MDVVDDVLQFYYSPPLSALTNRIFTRSVSHSVSVEWQRIYRVENGQKWTTNGRVQTPASGDHKMRAKETERQMNVLAFLLTPPLSGYFAKGGYYIKRIFEAKHNQISFFYFFSLERCVHEEAMTTISGHFYGLSSLCVGYCGGWIAGMNDIATH